MGPVFTIAILGSRLKAEAWLAKTTIKRMVVREVAMSACEVLKAYYHSLPLPPLPQCRHCDLLTSSHSHILSVVPGYFDCFTIFALHPPYSQNFAMMHCLLEGGILPACWLVGDYLQGPGVSAARRPLWPHSWASNWSGRIWGHPSTSTPAPTLPPG